MFGLLANPLLSLVLRLRVVCGCHTFDYSHKPTKLRIEYYTRLGGGCIYLYIIPRHLATTLLHRSITHLQNLLGHNLLCSKQTVEESLLVDIHPVDALHLVVEQ